MKRLFFALWPDESTRQRCRKIQRSLHGHGRPVSITNVHITLVFLGNVDEAQQVAMTKAAANIAVLPMKLVFNRLDYWKRPAVVCLTGEQIDPIILNLVEQLTTAAVQNKISVDQRPYKPHVTLLRKAKAVPEIEIKPIDWLADRFCLVESCSTPNGVEYRVIEEWACISPTAEEDLD